MTTITKLKAALAALEIEQTAIAHEKLGEGPHLDSAITDLRSVIAEMEAQKPYGWHHCIPLYTHPQTNLEKVSLGELKAIYQKYGTGRFEGFLEASKALFAIAQTKNKG